MLLPNLPLLYDGDSYLLTLEEHGKELKLVSIQRFENNENCDPEGIRFFDLDDRGRHAVLAQIHRRYPGRNVKI